MKQHVRLNDQLRTYWETLRGARKFPLEAEFDPRAIDEIWGGCFLVQLDRVSTMGHFKYTYLGQDLINAFGDNFSEEEAKHLVSTSDPEVTQHISQVFLTAEPLEVESSFINSHKVDIRFRTVLLPLGITADKVGFVVGGVRWKGF